MAQTQARDPHSRALRTVHDAIMNPDARDAARNDEDVGPILKKLSDADLNRLKAIAENQQLSPTCVPLPP